MNAGVVGTVLALLASVPWDVRAGEDQTSQSPQATARVPAPASAAPPVRTAARPNGFAPEAAQQAARSTLEQRQERSFLRQAAVLARFETEASSLALTRAQAPRVRSFAAELHQQQSVAAVELLHLLHARGMAMPMLENSQRKTLQRLGRLSGAAFDREYVEALGLRLQRDKVLSYERVQTAVVEPQLKSWLERQMPTARHQLAAAERVTTPASGQRVPARAVAPTSLAR